MRENKDKNTIFSLSPDPSLRNENVKAYYGFLKGALEAKRIHNIAITGGFGTGKSSLIRSYEKRNHPIKAALLCIFSFVLRIPHFISTLIIWVIWGNSVSQVDADRKPLNRFLYVSVGEYASTTEGKGKQQDSTTAEATLQNNMFLLVNTHPTRREKGISRTIPLPGNVIVKQYDPVDEHASDTEEKGNKQNNYLPRNDLAKQEEETTSIRAIERRLLLQIFARFRRADLPQSSLRLIPEAWTKRLWLISILFGGFIFSALLLCFHEQLGAIVVAVNSMEGGPEWGAWVMAFLVKYKTLFRLLLSAYCIGFGALASVFLCVRVLPRLRFREVTVKGANAELSLEREAAESYLDLYSMELVYCLEKLAKKIDHVVVFEDLDRLDSKDCLYIITRLREINNLVNLRLQKNGESLRFIYAINDEFLGAVQHEKFFDYILPVIPEMNRRSAAVLFSNKIKQIDGNYEVLDVFPQFEAVAACLSDYRLQNTILNEYQVLLKLYTATTRKTELDCHQKNEILAFAVYKNCWPEDYHALRENKSQVFTTDGVKVPDEIKSGKYGKLLEVLTKNHLLTLHSLYYAHFSEETLAEMCANHWESAIDDPQKHTWIISELDAIQKDESECISKVRKVFNSPSRFYSTPDEAKPDNREYHVPLFRAVLNCMVRCEQKDNNWFFVTDQYNTCIKLLAGLNDEALKISFFKLSREAIKDKNNFYGASVAAINGFNGGNGVGVYSNDELKELCRGMKPIPSSAHIKGLGSDSPESSQTVIKIRADFTASNSTPYFSE